MARLYGGVRLLGSGPCLDNVERIDQAARPMLGDMMARGMQVDLSHFARMDKELTLDMERITAEVERITGVYTNLGSGDQVSALLFKRLGLKQIKRKMTRSGDRESVEKDVLVGCQHQHEVVPKIIEYKEVEKLRGTYARPMPRLAKKTAFGQWRMFPKLGDTRVPSGRANCKEPNLLAIPTRTKRGRELRNGFITDPGWVYLSVDESQIEPRVGAHSSGDTHLIHIYETGEDIYSDFATAAFALKDARYYDDAKGKWVYPTVSTSEHRRPSKTCVLAAFYDVSPPGLLEQMPVVCASCGKVASSDDPDIPVHDCSNFKPLWTEDKCATLLDSFYRRYPGVMADRKRHHAMARKYGYVWDMWGRILHVAGVRSIHPWIVSSALREVGNFPYQSGATGTIKITMGQVRDDLVVNSLLNLSDPARSVCHPLLLIHDEILFECRRDVAEEIGELVKERFQRCVELRVPIKAGAATAERWGEVEK